MAKGNVEQELRQAITTGALAPASALRMEVLRARFDVGFSPIREALARLTSEGLVVFEPNRGFRVAPLSRDDLQDLAITRSAIESTALERAIMFGDDRWEADIVAAMHRYRRRAETAFASEVELSAWEGAHDELHQALVSACGSPRLLSFQRKLQEQHLRYRRLIVTEQVEPSAHIEEHEKLVALVLARDVPTALAELRKHLNITVDALVGAQFWETKGLTAAG